MITANEIKTEPMIMARATFWSSLISLLIENGTTFPITNNAAANTPSPMQEYSTVLNIASGLKSVRILSMSYLRRPSLFAAPIPPTGMGSSPEKEEPVAMALGSYGPVPEAHRLIEWLGEEPAMK
jgi:hypothetical protein